MARPFGESSMRLEPKEEGGRFVVSGRIFNATFNPLPEHLVRGGACRTNPDDSCGYNFWTPEAGFCIDSEGKFDCSARSARDAFWIVKAAASLIYLKGQSPDLMLHVCEDLRCDCLEPCPGLATRGSQILLLREPEQ